MQKLDVGALDTTGVDRIAQTFAMDHNLVEIDGLENWDVSKVTNFTSTFLSDYKIQCLVNLSNWEIQDNAHTDNMFNPSWVATPLMVIVKSGAQNINRGTDVFGKDNAQENATNRHGGKYAPAAAVKNTTKPQGTVLNNTQTKQHPQATAKPQDVVSANKKQNQKTLPQTGAKKAGKNFSQLFFVLKNVLMTAIC